ncbi:substrate-binding domain-containing protein [Arcobacter roscoffensis]|uniref:Substrate-binding domain-containing protein n=1 Tax=Arcobacter roscoffensis TaxID=2961520 RepID=A0ABY5E419_9BACT|nr:substrate-binding domain-containing protein [Arcobacter roscoffensis]UTJ06501.1 substrate-binding domain-containing protein [Arcobacter roscoffensis]
MKHFKILLFFIIFNNSLLQATETKKIVYITADMKIPFWSIMSKGINNITKKHAYDFKVYDSQNSAKMELMHTISAIKSEVDGIVVSPTTSSACVTILKLAKKANIPVVIADVGSDNDNYVSYISSNNKLGAYNIGKTLAKEMKKKGIDNKKVGIIAIPQKRLNGQQRTAGFMEALNQANIKGADIKQLITWSDEETYTYTKELINRFPELGAIWLQTSNIYKGAIKALKDSNKEKEILLIAFDAEPEFIELIKKNTILASGMQQPYLMGQQAAISMHKYLNNQSIVKNIQIPILNVSTANIKQKKNEINLNVLGIEN